MRCRADDIVPPLHSIARLLSPSIDSCHPPRSCSNKFEKCRKQQEAFEAAFKAKAE